MIVISNYAVFSGKNTVYKDKFREFFRDWTLITVRNHAVFLGMITGYNMELRIIFSGLDPDCGKDFTQ